MSTNERRLVQFDNDKVIYAPVRLFYRLKKIVEKLELLIGFDSVTRSKLFFICLRDYSYERIDNPQKRVSFLDNKRFESHSDNGDST